MHRSFVISSDKKNLETLRIAFSEVFFECGIDSRHFNRVFLAASEAVCNSIVHGNQLDSNKKVYVDITFSSSTLQIFVMDEGNGFGYFDIKDPTLIENIKHESGRGIYVMKNVADEVVFEQSGKKVLIKFEFKDEC